MRHGPGRERRVSDRPPGWGAGPGLEVEVPLPEPTDDHSHMGDPVLPSEGAGAAGPGLVDRDAPSPRAPDDLAAAMADETGDVLDRCAALLRGLEHRVGLALYEQVRARLAATPEAP